MITNTQPPLTGRISEGAEVEQERDHSTSTAAQRQRLLDFLVHNGSIDTMFARDWLNIMAPAARIIELRKKGHMIDTARLTISDRDGRSHPRVALYTLLKLAEVQP